MMIRALNWACNLTQAGLQGEKEVVGKKSEMRKGKERKTVLLWETVGPDEADHH